MTQQGMSTKSRHLTIPDLITIGVFTALYFVLVAVATLFSSVALMGFGMILLPAVAALICGCVYMPVSIHISEPTRRTPISYAVFCLKKKIHISEPTRPY